VIYFGEIYLNTRRNAFDKAAPLVWEFPEADVGLENQLYARVLKNVEGRGKEAGK